MAKKKSSSFELTKALGVKKKTKRKKKLSTALKPRNILGVSKIKRKIARKTGVPTTQAGRIAKLKRMIGLK